LSVVVPTYNEEVGIAAFIRMLAARLREFERPFEIVVVDNASEDATCEQLAPLLDGETIRLLRNEVNRGKGYSVRRGMLEARGELRLMCDADCGPSLASLPRMIDATAEVDLAIGSRVAPGASVAKQQPFRRRLVGWPFIALTRTIMREPAHDVYCGFKLWRAGAAEGVFSRQRLDGWVFDAEVLGLARRLGFRAREVGIEWADRAGSKLSIPRVLGPALRELLAARRSVRGHAQVATRQANQPLPERGS
jgi:dolichyl-phosphate beta-glucosyltransferase